MGLALLTVLFMQTAMRSEHFQVLTGFTGGAGSGALAGVEQPLTNTGDQAAVTGSVRANCGVLTP